MLESYSDPGLPQAGRSRGFVTGFGLGVVVGVVGVVGATGA